MILILVSFAYFFIIAESYPVVGWSIILRQMNVRIASLALFYFVNFVYRNVVAILCSILLKNLNLKTILFVPISVQLVTSI